MQSAKGKLMAIGGAEDKGADRNGKNYVHSNLNYFELGILKRIVEETGGPDSKIEVITTASMIPYEVGESYMEAFGKIGCSYVGVMHIRNRSDASREDFEERLRNCDAVMFSGGNQLRLSAVFGGTNFLTILHQRYASESNFLVAGTSAGAMAMSHTMIYEGIANMAHLKGEVKITTGLAFMDNIIFDSHFDKRGRFGRLAQAVAANPSCIGIGLGEDTGMYITDGNLMEAIGSGLVMILDGQDIQYSNIADIPEGNPISIQNLKVHFCEKGNGYDIANRRFIEEVKEGARVPKQVYIE